MTASPASFQKDPLGTTVLAFATFEPTAVVLIVGVSRVTHREPLPGAAM